MPRKERNKKRKAREKEIKKHDLNKPVIIPLEKIGSSEDPCFGKLNDPRHPTCQVCGDNEICAIVMGQVNHMKRLEQEKKHKFKDLEETSIKKPNFKEAKKQVRIEMRKLIKERGKIEGDEIVRDIFGKFMHSGITQAKAAIILKRLAEKSNFITFKNNHYIWKSK